MRLASNLHIENKPAQWQSCAQHITVVKLVSFVTLQWNMQLFETSEIVTHDLLFSGGAWNEKGEAPIQQSLWDADHWSLSLETKTLQSF